MLAESAAASESKARDAADIDRMVAQSRADATQAADRAMLLAVEAYKRDPSWKTAGAIQSVLTQQGGGLLGMVTGSGPYSSVQFGKSIVVAQDGESVAIWDAKTFRKVGSIPDVGAGKVTLSADDKFVAVTTESAVSVYDVASGNRITSLFPNLGVTATVFDPSDSERMAIGTAAGGVEFYRWRTAREDLLTAGHTAMIGNLSFSADGRMLASGANDGTARVWDARTGVPITPILQASTNTTQGQGTVDSVRFSRDGSLVAAASYLPAVKVWRVADGSEYADFRFAPGVYPWAMDISGNETVMALTGDGLHRFDLATKAPLSNAISIGGISVDVDASATTMAVATAAVIEFRALDQRQLGARLSLPLPPNFEPVGDFDDHLTVNHDTTRLLAFDTQAYLYDLTVAAPTWRVVEFPGEGKLQHATFTEDGNAIFTVHFDATQI